MSKTRIVAVRMPEWMYEKAQERAKAEYRTFSSQIRMYVEQQLRADFPNQENSEIQENEDAPRDGKD